MVNTYTHVEDNHINSTSQEVQQQNKKLFPSKILCTLCGQGKINEEELEEHMRSQHIKRFSRDKVGRLIQINKPRLSGKAMFEIPGDTTKIIRCL